MTGSIHIDGTVQDEDVRDALIASGIPVLPYAAGNPRLRAEPVIIPSRRMRALREAALAIHRLYDELSSILLQEPSHLRVFFHLTQIQEMLWYVSGGNWHGVARADVFATTDGRLAVAELNSDTPSGLDEAFLLGRYAETQWPHFFNPNAAVPAELVAIFKTALHTLGSPPPNPVVGVVYPTDIPEDQGMVVLYQSWLESEGFRVVLGAPANLDRNENGKTTLFGTEIDVLLRHYKTDWWSERVNVWRDSCPIPDSAPLLRELECVVRPMLDGKLAIVNPFGSVVTQNKLSLAFFHEMKHLFSPRAQADINRYVPFTRRLTSADTDALLSEKNDWVLKSDYGCEGAEVVVGRWVDDAVWRKALALAVPEHMVAQRYFEAETNEEGEYENYGMYLFCGRARGVYVRLSGGATNNGSRTAAVMERPPLAEHSRIWPSGQVSSPPPSPVVLDLLAAYTPVKRWLPFRMPLLLHSAGEEALVTPFEVTSRRMRYRECGSVLATMVGAAEAGVRSTLAIVCDLEGSDAVMYALGASDAASVVLQMENTAHAKEVVPLRETLGALRYAAHDIALNGTRLTDGECSVPLFLLDRRRMEHVSSARVQFNNRHWAYLPPIVALAERGITTILYIHPEQDRRESDDLNCDFVQYHESGIRLCFASPEEICSFARRGVSDMLETFRRIPLRRETEFSYLTDQPEEPVAWSRQEERH